MRTQNKFDFCIVSSNQKCKILKPRKPETANDETGIRTQLADSTFSVSTRACCQLQLYYVRNIHFST